MLNRGPLRAFAYVQYRRLWTASLLSIVSFFTVVISRGWLTLELTSSPFMVTGVNAVAMLPLVVFAPVGGAIADRMNRRLALIIGDAASCLLLFALALLILTGAVRVWQVFALSLLHGVTFAVAMPARAATVPDLVSERDLASGVAMFTTIFSGSQLLGPAPAGYLISRFGNGAPFMAASLLNGLAAGVLFFFLRLPARASEEEGAPHISVLASIAEGAAYVARAPMLVGLLLLSLAFSVFGMPYQSILPVIARDVLHAGADGLGLLAAGIGAGALVGSFAVASLSGPRRIGLAMVGGAVGFGLLLVLFAFSPLFWLSLVTAPVLGFAMQFSLTSNFTLVQVASQESMRGRVLSIRMLAVGLGPVGMLLLGVGAEALGPPRALASMAIVLLALIAVLLLRFPTLRRVEVAAREMQHPGTTAEATAVARERAVSGDD